MGAVALYDSALYGTATYGVVGADCWPVDTDAWDKYETYPDGVRTMAAWRATSLLRRLTGYRVGGCVQTFRPVLTGSCAPRPYIYAGKWYNGPVPSRITLPPDAIGVTGVTLDGAVLSPALYVIDGFDLVLLNGLVWEQDLVLGLNQPGTSSVNYVTGYPVDEWGARCAGLLAAEYSLSATGSKACRLPRNATSVQRQGVSIEMQPPGDSVTGIDEVDEYVKRWNPTGLLWPSMVYVPGVSGQTNVSASPLNG